MFVILLESALRSIILALAVWLILSLARIRNPRMQRLAWLIVLFATVAMPLLMQVSMLSIGPAPAAFWSDAIEWITFAGPGKAPPFAWSEVLLEIYALVTAVFVLRYIYALGMLLWLRRKATPIDVEAIEAIRGSDVRVSSAFGSPATLGSTILVPDAFLQWDSLTQRAVIAHERAHIRNKDFYVQCLAQVHRAVFWFSPLAWWLPAKLTWLSEQLSDDAAIDEIQERSSYAEILLGVAGGDDVPKHALAMARPATVVRRVERILDEDAVSVRPGWRRVCGLLFAILPCVLAAASLTLVRSEAVAADTGAAPSVPPGLQVVLPRSNPAMPLSQPMYPPNSRRLGEQGTVVLQLFVLTDGSVASAQIAQSSGYVELDDAAMYNAYGWHVSPGTVDGKATAMWGRFAVTFKLAD